MAPGPMNRFAPRPTRPRWRVAWILLAVLISSLRAAPAPAADASSSHLRLFYWQAPTVFNPHLAAGLKDWEACRMVYEPLATAEADGSLVPVLAESIPSVENGGLSPDGRWVTWTLKRGVRWSDGHPFTAADVVSTWRFISDPDLQCLTRDVHANVSAVEAVDPHTVRIQFSDAITAGHDWAVPFVGAEGMILPAHVPVDRLTDCSALAHVGTGPYRMTDVEVRDTILVGDDVVRVIKISYLPNPYFRTPGKPHFRRVTLHGGGDALMAARAVLQEGAADFAWNLNLSRTADKALRPFATGSLHFFPSPHVERILINFTDPDRKTETGERSSLRFEHPFLADLRVRQAIAHAVDRSAIAALYGRSARPTPNILVAPAQYRSPNTASRYPFDLERAADLLTAAGWTDSDGDGIRDRNGVPMRMVFQTSVSPLRQPVQEIVKSALESIGVDVVLKVIDASIFFGNGPSDSTMKKFYADLEMFFTGNASPYPLTYMERWTCNQVAQAANGWSGLNFGRFCRPAYDRLVAEAGRERDPAARRSLFIRMNDFLIEEVALVPLVNRHNAVGIGRSLMGVRITPWDRSTWNIADWRRCPDPGGAPEVP